MPAPSAAELASYEAALAPVVAAFDVPPALHPEDYILRFVLAHPYFASPTEALGYYLVDGSRSALQFAEFLARFLDPALAPPTVLEFASGYGCVSRHLAHRIPAAQIVPCDIHPHAVQFLQERLGLPALLSVRDPAQFAPPGGPFAVVFALSFFSHLPATTWGAWLRALVDQTAPDGLLIFTTHGRRSGRSSATRRSTQTASGSGRRANRRTSTAQITG